MTLSWIEVPDFQPLQASNRGLLTGIYTETKYRRSLAAYVRDYLSEEIINEAATATRKADALIRFFETLRFCHGEVYITPTVCWDYAVSAKNVKTYFDIVLDSLIGYRLYPFHRPRGRQSISAAHKFYLFDTGVAGHICQRTLKDMNGPEFGRAFEHFILIKLIGTRSYQEKDNAIN